METAILKAISEPTRFRMMYLLLKTKKEICGCEFVDSLAVPQYNLTKHLDILIDANLVNSKKEGKWVYYFACQDMTAFSKSICKSILKTKNKIHADDLKRFSRRLGIRKNGKCLLGIQNKKLVSWKEGCEMKTSIITMVALAVIALIAANVYANSCPPCSLCP